MMMRLFFLLLVSGTSALAASYHLVNLGPEFKAFVKSSIKSDERTRWQAWKTFEKNHLEIIDVAICDAHEAECEKSKKKQLADFFKLLPEFQDRMWKIFDQAPKLTDSQIQKFRQAFPDLRQDVDVIFMPALFLFNGKGGVKFHDHYALFIGVDLVALRQNNLDVLFSHEFFHVYQFEKLISSKLFQTMASPLWLEGFATWESSQMNPTASQADILMNAELAKYCEDQAHIREMASEYLKILQIKSNDSQIKKTRIDWFSGGADVNPKRKGYCLGYKALQEVMKDHQLKDIVNLNEDAFSKILSQTLKKLEAAPNNLNSP
jgi:hypothetical protein